IVMHNALSLTINGTVLPWKNEIRYLGIIINSSKHFTFNIQCVKHKFFRALNGIFGEGNLNTSVEVLCSLIYTYCIPILLYGCESLSWNAKQISSIENACTQAFGKMLKTFDKKVIMESQFFLGCLPVKFLLSIRKLNFMSSLNKSK